MKNKSNHFVIRGSVVAVQAALLALAAVSAARAADSSDAAAPQLTAPTNSVEVGAGYVTQDNVKFGQYNGLFNKGPFGIFNIDLSGGGAYDSGDPTRWRIVGNNLGLDSRDVSAEFGKQGLFKIDFGFDQLHQIKSDTYQTPYLGAGSDTLTLPPTWLKPYVPQAGTSLNFRGLSPTAGLGPTIVNGVVTPPTADQQTALNNIIATDLPDFHNVDLSTKRTTYKGGFAYDIDRNWEFKVSGQHQTKDGLKPLGSVSSQVREFATILAYPVDESTDQYNVSLTYNVPKGFMQVAYYGSIYKNDIKSLTWQDPGDPTKNATLSSAPSNDFHQFLLTGGYNFTPTTKLVMDASYGRTTQDDSYLTTGQNNQYPLGLPQSSLNGRVVTEAFNARFTSRPVDKLNVVANYKYDDRHNETPVNTYYFQDANEAASSAPSPFNAALGLAPNTLASNINIYANRPYSKKLNQFNAEADYAIAKGQNIKGGYEYQQIDRNCDGSWINCADAPRTRENTLSAEWRANVIENVSSRILYAYSERRVNYDPNAFLSLVPMANVVPSGGATVSAYQYLVQTGLTGFGPVAGYPATPLTGDAAIFSPNNNILPQSLYGSRNNINELVGMMRYNMADRNRDKLRASINWDATDKLSLNAGLDYNKDDYSNSVYGLKNSENWALNFDATFAASSDLVINGFYTHEDTKSESAGISYASNSNTAFVGQAGNTIVSGGCFSTVQARNNNTKIDPCNDWSTDMRDKADTFGVSFRQKNLMAGKLEVLGDLTYTDARTDIGVSGGSYANNPLALGTPAPALAAGVPAVYFIPAVGMPTVSTKTIDVRLSAQYSIDKHSAVRFLYWYEHLNSSDYYFDGVQFGTLTNVMPTNEQPFHENVNVVGVSYIYRWQ